MFYRDRFLENLSEISCDKQNFLHEWKYAGGDKGTYKVFFEESFPSTPIPEQKSNCVCGKEIVSNFYLHNTVNQSFVVIGKCCVDRYMDDETYIKTCNICNKSHTNLKTKWCKNCRGNKLDTGKYKGKYFREVFEEDRDYCQWILENTQWKEFKDFLWENDMHIYISKDTLLEVGKYKGKTFEWVLENDKKYVNWVLSSEKATGSLNKFQTWVKDSVK